MRDILESNVDEKYYLDEDKTVKLVARMLGHVDIRGHDSIKRTYSTEGISPTLTTMGGGHREPEIAERRTCIDDTQGFDGVRLYDDETPSLRSSRSGLKVAEPKYRIRKLTPRECWRLQGFPDVAHDAVESAGISDSQRYKQAGNAVTVNVIEAIGERLIPLIAKD